MTQLELDGSTPLAPPTVKVTERQRYVLELVRDLGHATDDEIGAVLCERLGKHSADVRCGWDATNGGDIARVLRKKGLVKYRRDVGWVLAR